MSEGALRPWLACVAKRGHALVERFLSERAHHCYWATLLRGFAARLPFAGELHPGARTIEATLWAVLRQYADGPA